MEKVCKNCEYFAQASIITEKYSWGDCMKPGSCVIEVNGEKEHGVFMWSDKTCCDFKPNQKLQQASQVGD
jgi:hypothetical protein